MMSRRNWQRHELLLALNLYCRLPFGQYHSGNAEINQLAQYIGRTPNAVAMKLSNFASLDPYHQARGIKGLPNVSNADRAIWHEFNTNWDALAAESEAVYAQLTNRDHQDPVPPVVDDEHPVAFTGATEAERQTKVRLGQQFFRKVILTSYDRQCCVCGMPIPALLIASHIVPWHEDANLRVNPHNGLCLCALHDKGFDRGYFTLDENYAVVVGDTLHDYLPNTAVEHGFNVFDGHRITLPDKFIPSQAFLAIHRQAYFLG